MSKSMKNMVLLAKAQTAIDVEAVPTPALNSMLVRGMTPSIIDAEFVKRNNIRGYKGNFGSLAVGVHRMFEFEVELAGSGTAGLAPKWAALLMCCEMNETLVAVTSATYAFVGSGAPYLTLLTYLDDILIKMINCKGSASFEINPKGIPVIKFKMMGEYSTPTDATFPTGMVYTDFKKPLTVGKTNTPTCTFFGLSAAVQALSFDFANTLTWRDLIGFAGADSPDRAPTGNITFELPTIAAMNLGEIVRLGTEGEFQLIHGTLQGNIIEVKMSAVQIASKPTISNDNERAMVQVQFDILPTLGNDEIVIVAR